MSNTPDMPFMPVKVEFTSEDLTARVVAASVVVDKRSEFALNVVECDYLGERLCDISAGMRAVMS